MRNVTPEQVAMAEQHRRGELPDRIEGAEEMVGELHHANPSVPVLVMTTIEEAEVHERFLRAGASEVLAKDVPFGEVLAAVRRLGSET